MKRRLYTSPYVAIGLIRQGIKLCSETDIIFACKIASHCCLASRMTSQIIRITSLIHTPTTQIGRAPCACKRDTCNAPNSIGSVLRLDLLPA